MTAGLGHGLEEYGLGRRFHTGEIGAVDIRERAAGIGKAYGKVCIHHHQRSVYNGTVVVYDAASLAGSTGRIVAAQIHLESDAVYAGLKIGRNHKRTGIDFRPRRFCHQLRGGIELSVVIQVYIYIAVHGARCMAESGLHLFALLHDEGRTVHQRMVKQAVKPLRNILGLPSTVGGNAYRLRGTVAFSGTQDRSFGIVHAVSAGRFYRIGLYVLGLCGREARPFERLYLVVGQRHIVVAHRLDRAAHIVQRTGLD